MLHCRHQLDADLISLLFLAWTECGRFLGLFLFKQLRSPKNEADKNWESKQNSVQNKLVDATLFTIHLVIKSIVSNL